MVRWMPAIAFFMGRAKVVLQNEVSHKILCSAKKNGIFCEIFSVEKPLCQGK